MFVPRTLRDFGELVVWFNEKKVAVRVDSERQIVDVGELRLRWDDPFLHVTRPILAIPAGDTSDVVHAIVAHNHEAQLPVLDFDAASGALTFRITTPVLVDGVRVDLLEALLGGIDAHVEDLRVRFAHRGGTPP
jgi:hypothetical protein